MKPDYEAIVNKIIKAARRGMRETEKEYPDLINSYTEIDRLDPQEIHALGHYSALKDITDLIKENRNTDR